MTRNPRKPAKGWHYRPPRRVHVLDPARQISIRRDDAGWHVVNGLGVVLADGFLTNTAALAWVGQHNATRVKQGSPSRGL